MKDWMLIGLGGGLGALLRYGALIVLPAGVIPWNVGIINLSGSLIIGMVMALTVEFGRLSERTRLFVAVGILGGFTTFSTFAAGSYDLVALHAAGPAALYMGGSLIGGLLAAYLGMIIVRVSFRVSDQEQDY